MKVRVPASLGADLRRLELLDVGAAVAELEATLGAELPVVQIAAVPRHPLPAEPELRVDGGAVADVIPVARRDRRRRQHPEHPRRNRSHHPPIGAELPFSRQGTVVTTGSPVIPTVALKRLVNRDAT